MGELRGRKGKGEGCNYIIISKINQFKEGHHLFRLILSLSLNPSGIMPSYNCVILRSLQNIGSTSNGHPAPETREETGVLLETELQAVAAPSPSSKGNFPAESWVSGLLIPHATASIASPKCLVEIQNLKRWLSLPSGGLKKSACPAY